MTTTAQLYLKTVPGRQVVKEHSLNEASYWQLFSEDNGRRSLGFMAGKLEDVIEAAVALPSFWSSGAGGWIHSVDPIRVNHITAQQRSKLREERDQLVERIKQIDISLGERDE